jgi:hypothetical protein
MVMLTMGHSMAGDIRLPDSLRPLGSRSAHPTATLAGVRRNRLQATVLRSLRAVAYTAVAVVAFGGLPMVCAMLYDASAFTLLFSR